MSDIETLYSLPGEWIGAEGRSRPRGRVQRILVLKPDHIGDLLIVDKAFALLRHFFPHARIELVCGRWNVQLATKLGRFDVVHGVDLFHEISEQQSKQNIAEMACNVGTKTLCEMRLGYFDLAMDFRYDIDTRPILRNIDAGVYAGLGRAPEFPFLDIVVPRHEGCQTAGPEEELIPGDRFGPRLFGAVDVPADAQGNGDLWNRRSTITLTFDIKGAATPCSCGTSSDDRLLGIGFERIQLTPLTAQGKPLDNPIDARASFGAGWGHPETWGRWSTAGQAQLSIVAPHAPNAHAFRLDLSIRAHVNPQSPRVHCSVQVDGATQAMLVAFEYPMDATSIGQIIPAKLPRRELVSPPFELTPGRYDGTLRILASRPIQGHPHIEYVLRSVAGNVELLRGAAQLKHGSRGVINLPFVATVNVSGSKLFFEIETSDAALLDGVRINQVNFVLRERLKTTTPVAHMSDWASLLVLRAAQVLSDEAPFGKFAPHRHSALAKRPNGVPPPPRLVEFDAMISGWKASGDVVIGVALGCNSDIRRWPLLYFFDLIGRMIAMGKVRIVFIGAPAEQPEAIDACAQLGLDAATHALCGVTSLDWLGVFLSQLDLFVGNNTGTTHFAGKVGVRTIGIYAGTNHPREWGPIGEEASWIFRNEPCAPCHLTVLRDCTKGHRCMVDLLPETVFGLIRPEIEAILSRRERLHANDCDGQHNRLGPVWGSSRGAERSNQYVVADVVGGRTGQVSRNAVKHKVITAAEPDERSAPFGETGVRNGQTAHEMGHEPGDPAAMVNGTATQLTELVSERGMRE